MADPSNNKESQLELSIEVLTVLASWPIVVLLLLYAPKSGISETVDDILRRSNTIKLGELNFEISPALTVQATKDIREVLEKASNGGVKELVSAHREATIAMNSRRRYYHREP